VSLQNARSGTTLCAVLSSSTSKTVERAPATVHSTSSRQHPERAQPWAHR